VIVFVIRMTVEVWRKEKEKEKEKEAGGKNLSRYDAKHCHHFLGYGTVKMWKKVPFSQSLANRIRTGLKLKVHVRKP